jgi:peptidoglycan LD-endopeptidase CwlK
MSAPLFTDDVKFLQRMLCAAGCYSGPADGLSTPTVDAAETRLEEISNRIASAHGTFDPRSERNIRSLHPKAQEAARQHLHALRSAGLDARIISGTRTYAEQDALFQIGRATGDVRKHVTNAEAGHSNHNFGIAWDIGIFDNGKYLTDEAPYRKAATVRPSGVEWGGDWKSFSDPPHYQLAVGKKLAEVRECFESGKPYVNV